MSVHSHKKHNKKKAHKNVKYYNFANRIARM